MVILICYETKIIATLSLPVGWVSYLVLVFAIFGILSFLLVHPIATEKGNLWMRTFNRWFYYLLVPLLGLLFWAILYRIHLYGFTHERYYVLLLSIWLTIVVAYFLIRKQPKIKFIPISLCITALFSIIGPQSADSVSKNSQLSRFEFYIQKAEKGKLNFKQEQDLSSIVDFLEKNYGVKILLPYTNNKLNALLLKDKTPSSSQIMNALGLKYHYKYESHEKEDKEFYYNFNTNEQQDIENIHGYDMSFTIGSYNDLKSGKSVNINNKSYSILSFKKEYGIDLHINQDIIPIKIVDFVNENSAFDQKGNSEKKIIQKIETPKYTFSITYFNASGKIEGKKKKIEHFRIKVLVSVKN